VNKDGKPENHNSEIVGRGKKEPVQKEEISDKCFVCFVGAVEKPVEK
jgi:hypothetical protein